MRKTIWIPVLIIAVAVIGFIIWRYTTMNNAAQPSTPIIFPQYPATASTTPSITPSTTPSAPSAAPLPPVAGPGKRCGGNMQNAPICTAGYHCAPEPGSHLPFGDVGGTCVVTPSNGGKG